MQFGECVVQLIDGQPHIIRADDVIQVDAELAEARGIGHEGGRITLTEDVAYELSDWTPFSEGDRFGNTFIGRKVH